MAYTHFDEVKRMELAILRKKGYSMRDIALALGVNHSSVVRELKRNCVKGDYDPSKADHKAHLRRKYSKYQGMKVRNMDGLEEYIIRRLKEDHWTPEQISGELEKRYGYKVISLKGVYRWLASIYGQKYKKYLPYDKKKRGRKKQRGSKNSHIPHRVSIEERPKIIEQRTRIGDFEGDTLGRPRSSSQTLVAIVDRKSRFLMALKVPQMKHSMEGFKALLKDIKAHSLTLDNGLENISYETLDIPTYFCHAYSSWEKGTVENMFQRLRRFIPKKARLEDYSDERIASIVEKMNNTPRKCLDFRTPAQVFKEQTDP